MGSCTSQKVDDYVHAACDVLAILARLYYVHQKEVVAIE